MEKFANIYQRASERKGGAAALKRLMPKVRSPRALANTGDDRYLSEMTRCVFQAGFVWRVVDHKWDDFEDVFFGFPPEKILLLSPDQIDRLCQNPRIIRNRQKIEGSVLSARAYLDIEEKEGFSNFLWKFVDGKPVQNRLQDLNDIQAETETSKKMSKALKDAGFKFCGPTIVYAFMQATGMVNDHLVGCHCHAKCAALALKK